MSKRQTLSLCKAKGYCIFQHNNFANTLEQQQKLQLNVHAIKYSVCS